MPKPDEVVYVYEPQEGLFITGMPQADLTQADVDRLGPAMIQEAVATRLYRKASKEEKEAARKVAEQEEAAAAKEAEAQAKAAEKVETEG
jgi:hypothetical protein